MFNLRDFASPPHFKVDDTLYGGSPGMLMTPIPLSKAIDHAKSILLDSKVIFFTPSGLIFNQEKAQNCSRLKEVILICGRYEGIDQRIIDLYVDFEISIGDYILMGGELPAMVYIEAVSRLIPNVLGNAESIIDESFGATKLLEPPQYTKPETFKNIKVPEILLSGHHKNINKWRTEKSEEKTSLRRPDLLKKVK